MKKITVLLFSICLLISCNNKSEKSNSNNTEKLRVKSYGYLKNVRINDNQLYIDVDLIDVDKNNNINNQSSEITSFVVVDKGNYEEIKTEFLTDQNKFIPTEEIFIIKKNENGDVTGIKKHNANGL